jgi:hypothetical protein
VWDEIVEDKIKSAEENGAFKNLRGEGKPLPKDDGDPNSPDWLGNHLLKEAGFLPNWLQLRKEICEERPRVVAALAEYRRFRDVARLTHSGDQALLQRLEENYVRLARAINSKIDEHNIWCPSIAHELVRFQEDAIARTRRPRGY